MPPPVLLISFVFQIMVVKDIEREDIEHVCKSLGCGPIASLDHFTADKLASAELVEEVQTGASKTVRVTGIAKQVQSSKILIKHSHHLCCGPIIDTYGPLDHSVTGLFVPYSGHHLVTRLKVRKLNAYVLPNAYCIAQNQTTVGVWFFL